jgi:hypothetical protein
MPVVDAHVVEIDQRSGRHAEQRSGNRCDGASRVDHERRLPLSSPHVPSSMAAVSRSRNRGRGSRHRLADPAVIHHRGEAPPRNFLQESAAPYRHTLFGLRLGRSRCRRRADGIDRAPRFASSRVPVSAESSRAGRSGGTVEVRVRSSSVRKPPSGRAATVSMERPATGAFASRRWRVSPPQSREGSGAARRSRVRRSCFRPRRGSQRTAGTIAP